MNDERGEEVTGWAAIGTQTDRIAFLRRLWPSVVARIEHEAAVSDLERLRQVHARHDLGHQLGAWPNACALCEFASLPGVLER